MNKLRTIDIAFAAALCLLFILQVYTVSSHTRPTALNTVQGQQVPAASSTASSRTIVAQATALSSFEATIKEVGSKSITISVASTTAGLSSEQTFPLSSGVHVIQLTGSAQTRTITSKETGAESLKAGQTVTVFLDTDKKIVQIIIEPGM
ncbi:MAG: hypothetical protein JWM46_30 [Candidatus Kaiserbacteria bacterium]|nr:hypothetical protein [Candidatus Kaiserbacteria bacterium]